MSIAIEVTNAHKHYRLSRTSIIKYIRRVLGGERLNSAEISVVFVNSTTIRRLNREYLKHDYATDVLAFGFGETKFPEGEIYINVDMARRQASSYKVPLGEEVARLVIHGTLHLAGYDDTEPGQARIMKKKEDAYVSHWFNRKRGEG